jgi:hypothetical protein
MIDIESDVIRAVEQAVAQKRPDVAVYDMEIRGEAVFPCIVLYEADNYSLMSSRDTGSTDNHAQVMYELNVYSNLTAGRKRDCRAIYALADETLCRMGFTRMGTSPVDMQDATIYRLTGRYSAVVGRDKMIYRRA